MEEQRKIYSTFLALHASKASTTSSPKAHVMFYDQKTSMSPMQPLITMSMDDLLEELDKDSELVRWLLQQMSTYDCCKQKLIALVFDRQTVLSDVLRI